ncbi:MAG TPA: prepilin-type N-terminal cleavage/methylation domain-containing protein [Chthoniobacteraceae bacterium]|nr:prepilin-type N-terminal cleavage/methylation domain-containing protein [Chthoniobacteraceae bacterium]
MKTALHRNRLGFTLVEIMIVVTIISIIASIAIPAYGRSRKRAQATRTLEELRMLEYALDRWAIEQNKSVGDAAALSDLVPYLKNGSTLSGGVDILGNTYGDAFSVDYIPKVNDLTFEALSDVAPAAFWSPYK